MATIHEAAISELVADHSERWIRERPDIYPLFNAKALNDARLALSLYFVAGYEIGKQPEAVAVERYRLRKGEFAEERARAELTGRLSKPSLSEEEAFDFGARLGFQDGPKVPVPTTTPDTTSPAPPTPSGPSGSSGFLDVAKEIGTFALLTAPLWGLVWWASSSRRGAKGAPRRRRRR